MKTLLAGLAVSFGVSVALSLPTLTCLYNAGTGREYPFTGCN